ncbi:hypothetical protein KGA66_12610, partial [Actinocrinis puniceicyclus]
PPYTPPYTPPVTVVPPGDTQTGFPYVDTPPGNTSTRYPHGSIARAQILLRTQSWLSEHVPYSQSSWWKDGNGDYRQDCSGYVSMAWALDPKIDFWTGNLNTVSHVVDASALLPGDILLSASHTVIFAGWSDSAHTTFDYYEESRPGTDARFVVSAPLQDFLDSGFAPFRYDGVVDTAGEQLPQNPATGLDFSALQGGSNELAPNGNDTAQPPPAPWQSGFLPSSSASLAAASHGKDTSIQAAAAAENVQPPLGFVLGASGTVFLVGGVVLARGYPQLASTRKRPRRRH